jgi:hypothetical protein
MWETTVSRKKTFPQRRKGAKKKDGILLCAFAPLRETVSA